MDADELRAILAAQIRKRTQAKGLTVVELAKRASVGVTQLYDVLGGRRAATTDWLVKIAVALDCEVWQLLRPHRPTKQP